VVFTSLSRPVQQDKRTEIDPDQANVDDMHRVALAPCSPRVRAHVVGPLREVGAAAVRKESGMGRTGSETVLDGRRPVVGPRRRRVLKDG